MLFALSILFQHLKINHKTIFIHYQQVIYNEELVIGFKQQSLCCILRFLRFLSFTFFSVLLCHSRTSRIQEKILIICSYFHSFITITSHFIPFTARIYSGHPSPHRNKKTNSLYNPKPLFPIIYTCGSLDITTTTFIQ